MTPCPPCPLLPALALVLTTSALASPTPAQDDVQVRWYDLRPLLTRLEVEGVDVDLRLHLSSSRIDTLEPDRFGIDAEPDWLLGADDLAQVVADNLAESLPDLDAFAEESGGLLRVEGPPEAQELAVRLVDELRSALLRSVDLELVGLDPAQVPADARGVLSAAEAEALLGGATPATLLRRDVLTGRRTLLGREGIHAILFDYDVEVASKASTADPQVSVVRDGVQLGVVARETSGGRLLLRVWGRAGQLPEDFETTPLPDFAGAPLECVREHTRLMVAAAEVEDGGALLLRTGDGPSDVWVLRARRSGPDRDRPNPLVSLADACLPPLLAPPPWLHFATPSGGWPEDASLFFERFAGEPGEPLLALDDVLDRLYVLRDDLGEGTGPYPLGHQVWLGGSEAFVREGRATVEELQRSFAPHTVELELRYGLVDAARAGTLGAGDAGWDEASLAPLDRRLSGACRTGDGLMLVSGEERFYLQDHDVEIAEAATIADPIVGLVFTGASLWARPLEIAQGRYQVFTQLQVHADGGHDHTSPVALYRFLEDPTRTELKRPAGGFTTDGRLTLPSTARAGGAVLLDLQEGRWTTVLRESLGGSGQVLVAVARLRRAR